MHKILLRAVLYRLFLWTAIWAGCLAGGLRVARADEYRAFWVDGWGAGFLNQSQVDTLLGVVGDPNSKGRIREANCNMVIVQVRRRADVCYPSGMGEPYFSGLSPSNFNALQAMISAAHDTTGGKKRVEVHCWSVVFKTANGLVYSLHSDPANPDNYWPTRLGSTTGSENSDGAFDPGHPKCLEYLVNVHMDLVTRFDIDGIHYDYIRFEGNTEGYNPTSVARYNERYGLSGDPSSSSEQFKQWRRDQVTAFVRQMYARIQAVKPHVKQSGSFVTWNPSPTSSTRAAFMATRPYYDVYSDWDSWMEEGIVDMAVPMTYYDWASLPNDYTRWMNFEKDRKFNRHMIVGPGIYLNSLSNALYELQQTRWASPAGNYAQGFSGYSYRVPYSGGTWAGFSPSLVADVTPTWDDVPTMPWKTNPTTGHICGTVTQVPDGAWADHATVSITGPVSRSMHVDGTGFYAFIDLPPGSYSITASKAGYANAVSSADVAIGQVTGNMYVRDLVLGGNPLPVISSVQATNVTDSGATITWLTDLASSSQVEFGLTTSYGNLTPPDSTPVTSHSVTLSGLVANTLYHYRVISTNANGASISSDYSFKTAASTTELVIDNTDQECTRTGSWNTGSIADVPKVGTNYLYTPGTGNGLSVTATCRWTPTIVRAGLYDVYVFYQMGSNRNSAAPYTVVYDGGQVVSIQNQYSSTPNQGGWFLVGENLPFAAGTGGYVECANNSTDTRYISADAAKLVFKSGIELPPAKAAGPNPSHQATGIWTHTGLSWTAGEGATSHRVYFGTSSPGSFQIETADAVFDPGALLAATTYFWRIDEVNASGTTTGDVWEFTTRQTVAADLDRDGDVDAADGDLFESCVSGPGVSLDEGCADRDLDGDGDADQSDFGVFQRCLSGTDVPVDPGCGG
ncbi:MAG TPA: family 10 glycosylhydrolase [Phycisphaerae bacterium]|nr:family 10 glycosylhydrolase [Phycisphaerae bacterium]HRR85052.1 family 10 glycosylhydrolase [Phycisphaerae bacterium]